MTLSARGLSVRFGGVQALDGVDLDVGEGQLVGLIGPNGAGKTTLIDALTGFVRADGEVRLGKRDLSRAAAHTRARHGLARTWQSVELFDGLTVAENLAVAAHRPGPWRVFAETLGVRSASGTAVTDSLDLLGLSAMAEADPADLSQGQRKLVGVARALACSPRVICLDEPAAGLDTTESVQLGKHLRQVADQGTAMLLVDHDMGLVLGICDYVVVLEFGRVIAHGSPEQVRNDPAVIAAYLGGATEENR